MDFAVGLRVIKVGPYKRLGLLDELSYRRFVDSLEEGQRISATFSDDAKRSNQYSRFYWGVVLKLISEHTGDDTASLHEYFKKRFNPIVVMGEEVGGSTAGMNPERFDQFVKDVRHFALMNLEVHTPDPDPAQRAA